MNFLKVLLFLFGLLAEKFSNNVQALESESIVGGDEAELHRFPYQVSIRILSRARCGGIIIDDLHILTAAHCVALPDEGWLGVPMNVVAGHIDLKKDVKKLVCPKINVEKIYVPEQYFSGQENNTFIQADIAILKLERSIGIKNNPRLGRAKFTMDSEFVGERAQVSGFGWDKVELEQDENNKIVEVGDSTGLLRYAYTTVLNQTECQSRYRKKIKDTHICAQMDQRDPEKPEGICGGDSGGPLVYRNNTIIGVVSIGPTGCREDARPGIYTRISSFKDFIYKAINDDVDSSIRTIDEMPIVETDLLDKSFALDLDDD